MDLPLPDALLLCALHPERGTVLPSAYLVVEACLRGAVLAELKLGGHVQTRRDGTARLHPQRPAAPPHPVLRDAVDALARTPGPTRLRGWFEVLAQREPSLRHTVTSVLRQRGTLRAVDRQRSHLPQQTTSPAADPGVRQSLIAEQRRALSDGDDIRPRDGMLLGLCVASRLGTAVFGELSALAEERAAWVRERDAIVRTAARLADEAEA